MIVAGCDVGSATTKAVVMDDRGILAFQIARTRGEAVRSACEEVTGRSTPPTPVVIRRPRLLREHRLRTARSSPSPAAR